MNLQKKVHSETIMAENFTTQPFRVGEVVGIETDLFNSVPNAQRLPDTQGLVRSATKHRSEAQPAAAGTAADRSVACRQPQILNPKSKILTRKSLLLPAAGFLIFNFQFLFFNVIILLLY